MSAAPRLFDRIAIRRHLARADGIGRADFLVRSVAADLAERLSAVTRRFEVAADIGTPGVALARALEAGGQVGCVERIDILAHDETEPLPLAPASLDLAVSALVMQAVDDLPGLLAQLRRALKPDGLLLVALAGGETLTELRQCLTQAEAETTGGVSPRVAPFVDVREMGALLQRAGFALPVADVERITVRYDGALDLMRDLRAMGASNPLAERRRMGLRRATLASAVELYAGRFADADGRVRATVDVVHASGWVPHDSQPKPLKPGSASARLADALGTVERKAGEKAGR